jgi:multisubunit Na+/H+ antiporter MnhB subunit
MSVGKAFARALVLAFLSAFVWIGGAALFSLVARDTLNLPLDPEVSSDFVLAAIGVSHPTNAVNEMLRPWGENKVLLVVAPTSNPVSMQVMKVYYELMILGYPPYASHNV